MCRFPSGLLGVPALGVLALFGGIAAFHFQAPTPAAEPGESERLLLIELFVREGSPQCERARDFVSALERQRHGVRVVVRDIARTPTDLDRLRMLARHFSVEARVPAIYTTSRLLIGFRDAATTGRQVEDLLRMQVFTREGCPRCALAMPYVNDLARRYPGLSVEVYEVTRDAAARAWCERLTQQYGIQAPGFPTFHLCGRLIVGYSGLETTGAEIEALLHNASVPFQQPRASPTSLEKRSTDDRSAGRSAAARVLLLTGLQIPPRNGTDALPAEAELPAEADSPGAVYGPATGGESQRAPPPESIRVPLLGRLSVRKLGLPLFTFLIGLIDGFNPCAMWVLVLLLSVLVGLQDRRKVILIAGTFVVVSGVAYFAFMAAWLNVFLLIGFARPAQVILGLMGIFIGVVNVKDYFAFRRGLSLSIPESAKPAIYARVRRLVSAEHLPVAMVGAIGLALLVNTVELLCTAGLPALYTHILTYRQYPPWLNYLYLGLYNVAYMLDDTIVLTIVVATLSRSRLQEREGRWLKLVSGLVILAIGLMMIVKPEWLL